MPHSQTVQAANIENTDKMEYLTKEKHMEWKMRNLWVIRETGQTYQASRSHFVRVVDFFFLSRCKLIGRLCGGSVCDSYIKIKINDAIWHTARRWEQRRNITLLLWWQKKKECQSVPLVPFIFSVRQVGLKHLLFRDPQTIWSHRGNVNESTAVCDI